MSTLVAYDSSSEEESTPNVQDVSRIGKDVREETTNVVYSVPATVMDQDSKMVGPSIPENITQSYNDYEERIPTDIAATERDMVRYLTQPSHPMTEMPPSPPGSPDASTTSRLKHFLQLKANGTHFNDDLCRKSAFKNPSLLQNLMDRVGIDSQQVYKTSLPLAVFDPDSFPQIAYKEALLKHQQTIRTKEEAEKKTLSAAGKRIVDFTSGGVSTNSSANSSPGSILKRSKR